MSTDTTTDLRIEGFERNGDFATVMIASAKPDSSESLLTGGAIGQHLLSNNQHAS